MMKFVVAGGLAVAGVAAIERAIRDDPSASFQSGGFIKEAGLFGAGVVLILVGLGIAIFGD